ncbi:hypothetical protein [Marimonas arenosa]|uniref:hypothetical protein n=1 Tax=Marimonas arenosa TaxID=1795305 RepID=UPI0027D2A15E|nr:hypothetical protein [Marimonas arenosa]
MRDGGAVTRLERLSVTALTTLATMLALTPPLPAEQVFNEDVIVDGGLCAGYECASGDANTFGIHVKSDLPMITFEDSNGPDWEVSADSSGGNIFRIVDIENGSLPFGIVSGSNTASNDFALWVGSNGHVGFGRPAPAKPLHVMDPATPTLRMQQGTWRGTTYQIWDIAAGTSGFQQAHDETTTPFTIQKRRTQLGFLSWIARG